MGWIKKTSFQVGRLANDATEVCEGAGFTGDYVTPVGQKALTRVRVCRNGRTVYKSKDEALSEPKED